jgi:peptide/nickel transport system permease protein
MPNAAISTVTLAGVQVTFLIGGTVLVERIFSYEGIGNMAIDAMINRDLPLIQGLVLVFAVIFIALNLLIDLLNAWLDPRLQHG